MPPLSGPLHMLVLCEAHHPLSPSVALIISVALGMGPLRAHHLLGPAPMPFLLEVFIHPPDRGDATLLQTLLARCWYPYYIFNCRSRVSGAVAIIHHTGVSQPWHT